jgi:CBS domain-containing protein
MKVRDVMTKEPVVIESNKSVKEAARLLKDKKVSSLLVVKKEEIVGIVTERMIALSVAGEGKDPVKTKISEVMDENLISVPPDMELSRAAFLLEELEIRYLPVVEEGKLVGILSISDIASVVRDLVDCILTEVGARAKRRKEEK